MLEPFSVPTLNRIKDKVIYLFYFSKFFQIPFSLLNCTKRLQRRLYYNILLYYYILDYIRTFRRRHENDPTGTFNALQYPNEETCISQT
jgi:hypothetical protein